MGVFVGAVATRPSAMGRVVLPFFLILVGVALAAGGVLGARRLLLLRRTAPSRALAPRAKGEEASPLHVAIALPRIAAEFPDVWGVSEALEIRVRARAGERPLAEATADVTVRTAADVERAIARGPLDAQGGFAAAILVQEPGDLVLRASVAAGDRERVAERRVRFVRYADEIERLVDDYRQWATATLEGCRGAGTAREVADALARWKPEVARPAAEVARIYELVAYGERAADRELYEALQRAFGALDGAGVVEKRAPLARVAGEA